MEPEAPTTETPPPPRRLTRSRGDRVLGGVAGGLGRYFNVDPILFRLGFVVALLFGGAGAVLYLAALLLVPDEQGVAAVEVPTSGRNRALVLVGVVLLVVVGGPVLFAIGGIFVPFAFLLLLALAAAWAVTGRRPGTDAGDIARAALVGSGVLLLLGVLALGSFWGAGVGGDTVIAILVIAAGVALVAGAFIRPVRALIVPALAVALPAAFVAAAGIDLDGGYGEKRYRPAAAADVRDHYEVGAGRLVIDLRSADLPAGDRRMSVDVGMGEAVVLVPEDLCVSTTAQVGMGAVGVFDRDSGGVDVEWEDAQSAKADAPRLVVDADVGVGALHVEHDEVEASEWRWRGRGFDHGDPADPDDPDDPGDDHDDHGDRDHAIEQGNVACA